LPGRDEWPFDGFASVAVAASVVAVAAAAAAATAFSVSLVFFTLLPAAISIVTTEKRKAIGV